MNWEVLLGNLFPAFKAGITVGTADPLIIYAILSLLMGILAPLFFYELGYVPTRPFAVHKDKNPRLFWLAIIIIVISCLFGFVGCLVRYFAG